MKKYLIGLSLILSVNGLSQYFPTMDSDPVWNVLYWDDAQTGYGHTETLSFVDDTLHCGKTYEILKDNNNSYFLRTDSIKTFIKFDLECDSIEYLLYDFGLNKGDTVYVPFMIHWGSIDTIPVKIDSIYQMLYNGIQRTEMKVLYSPEGGFDFFRSMKWISGIGSSFHPIYSTHYPVDYAEISFNLLCFDSLNINLYKDAYYNTCDTTFNGWIGIDNSQIQSNFFVYPNPTSNLILIYGLNNIDSYNVQIIDINGRVVMRYVADKNFIDLSGIQCGLYYLIIRKNEDDELVFKSRILKQPSPNRQ
jgi:hypothetical protein